jgi:hypothetical protein
MVYMCADNNLEAAGVSDCVAMESIGSTTAVNVLLAVDYCAAESYSPFDGGKIYRCDNGGGSWTWLADYISEPNFGHPDSLNAFMYLAQQNYPADNYILVLWDHGGGWDGVCYDDSHSADPLTMEDLEDALSDPYMEYVHVVAFDACLMGQIEVAYEILSFCDYSVFSEDSIPWYGYPYEYWLDDLTTTPSMTPATLASTLVDRYCEAYDTGIYSSSGNNWVTLSAVQSSQVTALENALDTFSDALDSTSVAETHYSALSYAIGETPAFSYPLFIDLGCFASEASSSITDATIAGYASSLASAVTSAVSAEDHLSGAGAVTGLGVAIEDYGSANLALTSACHWDEFTDTFCSIGESKSDSLTSTAGYTYGFMDGPGDSVYYSFTPAATGHFSFSLTGRWDIGEDFDLFLLEGSSELDSSEAGGSSESVSDTLTGGTTYYVEVYCYSGCGAFRLEIPPGGVGGAPPLDLLLLIIIVIVIIVIIVIIVVCILLRRRRRGDI